MSSWDNIFQFYDKGSQVIFSFMCYQSVKKYTRLESSFISDKREILDRKFCQ